MSNKTNGGVIVAALIGLYLIFTKTSIFTPQTANTSGFFDLSQFDNTFDQGNVQRLADLYNVLLGTSDPNNGQPLSIMQQQLLLAQALNETGLFTSRPNLNLVDNFHNYTGIKGNSHYPSGIGSEYAQYPNIDNFVGDWFRILSKDHGGGSPLEAISVPDFVNRLNINGYFTDSPSIYQSNIQKCFNQLNNVAVA